MKLSASTSSPAHHINPAILREYDIRGIVGETLSEQDALSIGHAFASMVLAAPDRDSSENNPAACVGYDGRLTSPQLESALVDGLRSGGVDVVRIGCGPTPMLYYSVYEMNAAAGIMVTGSHNPPSHNGFKFMLGKRAFFGDSIRKLGQIITTGDYSSGDGNVTTKEIRESYISRLLSVVATQEKPQAEIEHLSVAWDAGNGAAGEIVQQLCERLPGRHIALFTEIDGDFPNHHPDPTVADNLTRLIDVVRRENCDLGIAFDGDGDRIGVVDGNGEILWADQLLLLYAEDVLKRHPAATVIADVKASQSLFDGVRKLGGKPLMWKTGHSHIKSKMLEIGAPLAGEMSGHIFFADDYYGFDDGLYAAVRLLRILGASGGESLAQWRRSLPPTFATPEIRFDCPEEKKFAIIDEIAARLQKDGVEFSAIDGMRVNTDDGWWLLRASNTQAALSARCEATSAAGLSRLIDSVRQQLILSGVQLPENFGSV